MSCPGPWLGALLGLAVVCGLFALPARSQSGSQTAEATLPGTLPAAAVKPDPKKAKAAYEDGVRAERKEDWEAAYSAYSEAANLAPSNHDYLLRREIAKSRLVRTKMDAAERDAVSGRLDDARRELLGASYADPSNSIVRERLAEMLAAKPAQGEKVVERDLAGEVHLAYQSGTKNFDYRGDTQGAYEEIARQFGVETAFDVDLHMRQVHFRAEDVDFPTATRLLGEMTGTFWRPLTPRLFFVTDDTAQKRKEYDSSIIRTMLLPASETPDQMTEMLRTVREITGITRTDLDTNSRTLTMRASPRAIAVASDLIDTIEQPSGEMVLEIEILEVDRNQAMQLGITPPQSSQIYTFSTQQIQEAESSSAGLINVIEQVFG
jgi:general secretion pathway protein D